MTRYAILFAPLAFLGCSDKGGDSGAADGGDGGGGGCDVTIAPSTPLDGATDAYYRGTIEFTLQNDDGSGSITVDGVSGSTTSRANPDGSTNLVFTPDSPLAPSTSYTANAEACGGAASGSVTFTTSALGTPIAGSCDPTGETYTINLNDARFLEPAGVASLLLGQLEDDILVGVDSFAADSVQMIGAIGTGGTQDYCNPTIPFPAADFEDPYFSIGPQDVTLSVAGLDVEIAALTLQGDMASDCSYLGGATLGGELDARPLAPLVGELLGGSADTSAEEVCALLANFNVTCEPCSSDGEPLCVAVLVDQITANGGGTSIECVDEESCHPSCAENECADPTAGECE